MRWLQRWIAWLSRQVDARVAKFLVIALGVNVAFVLAFGALDRTPVGGPDGVDLQLSVKLGVFTQITEIWTRSGVSLERFWLTILVLDTLFPAAYASLLCGLYQAVTATSRKRFRIVEYLPFAAAAADLVENALLLGLLKPPSFWWYAITPTAWTVGLMSFFAILKLTLLAIVVGFIIADLIKGDAFRVIRTARYAVLSLLIGTLPLFALDQGRDLLVSLSHVPTGWHRLHFVVWLIVWAFSAWYWSRVLLDADAAEHTSNEFREWAKWLPRWVGALTLIGPGAALLMQSTRVEFDWRLLGLGGLCVLLGIAFVIFVSWRKDLFPVVARGKAAEGFARLKVGRPAKVFVGVSIVVYLSLFYLFTEHPIGAGAHFGAVAILAIAAGNTVFIGSLAVFVLRAYLVPLEAAALACAAIFSLWNDNHDVRLTPLGSRPTLEAAFKAWSEGAPAIDPGTVLIAAAEGGGIRAGYWAAAALHYLEDDVSFRAVPLSRRLFAISSVSGGSFGAAVYAALKKDRPGSDHRKEASQILQQPFLAPMVGMLVTGDSVQWLFPHPVRGWDRSIGMEKGLADAYREVAKADSLRSSLAKFATDTPQGPLLLFNSVNVQTGRRVVMSGVDWLPAAASPDADPIDFQTRLQADVTLATAAHNTARFPYISPAGRLRNGNGEYLGDVVDGGYFENTGTETVIDLIQAIKKLDATRTLNFVVIALADGLEQKPDPKALAWEETQALGEALTPLRALLQTRTARGTLAVKRLQALVGQDNFIRVQACNVLPEDERDADRQAPLGWQLSAKMIELMDTQASDQCLKAAREQLVKALGGS